MTIAIDFDGTIVEHKYPKIGDEIPFATDTLKMLINKDYPEEEKDKNNHFSRKLKADMFIDDRNFGGLPDWGTIYQMITAHETWESRGFGHQSFEDHQPRKKKHWWNL